MCCPGGPGGTRLTRCGVVCGLAALAALSTALLGPAWLHTEEKLSIPYLSSNSANLVSVRFKLGLFRVCPNIVKPSNLTIQTLFYLIRPPFSSPTPSQPTPIFLRPYPISLGRMVVLVVVVVYRVIQHV
ncbi:hypothetical protein M0802_006320 [Mischocyttarus mexicanus]|nr:hypothetical protein M0802_006320 [Mischocyttarus mexicanus]